MNRLIPVGKIVSKYKFNDYKVLPFIDGAVLINLLSSQKITMEDGASVLKSSQNPTEHQKFVVIYSPNIGFDKPNKILYTQRCHLGQDRILIDYIGLKVKLHFKPEEEYGEIIAMPNFGGGQLVEIAPFNAQTNKKGKILAKQSELYLLNDQIWPEINFEAGYAILKKPKILTTDNSKESDSTQ